MIVSHIVQCKAAVQVAPDAAVCSCQYCRRCAAADAADTDASVTNAAFTAPDADLTAPDAAPDHVCMSLRNALCNVRAHDRNVYRTQRADPPRNTGTPGGETQISRMLKL